jgi:hypothetical protein
MTNLQEVAPEELAKLFFHYREALAPDFQGAPSRAQNLATGAEWDEAAGSERELMVATARLVLRELSSDCKRNRGAQPAIGSRSQIGTPRFVSSEGKECGC